jgi:hypothetical protein
MLKRWWEQTDANNSYAERFELMRTFNRSDRSFGFFDDALLGERSIPVMGVVEEMLYDQPKHATGTAVRDEFREFVMHYFMRISDFRQPEVIPAATQSPGAVPGRGLGWCTERPGRRSGFGYSQHFYKLRSSGLVGKFPRQKEFAIVDLREVGAKYDWVIAKVRIFDFNLTFGTSRPDTPQLILPLQEDSYLVLSSEFIRDEDNPEHGVLGRYGFGYAFIKHHPTGLLAYGPGLFDAAFKLINFDVLTSGETRVQMVFVANRPDRILNLSLNPVDWSVRIVDFMSGGLASRFLSPARGARPVETPPSIGFDPLNAAVLIANFLSAGLAAEQFCISKSQLEKEMLVQHFRQHYEMIVGSLMTWRRIPNWLDEAGLPKWVITGVSA